MSSLHTVCPLLCPVPDFYGDAGVGFVHLQRQLGAHMLHCQVLADRLQLVTGILVVTFLQEPESRPRGKLQGYAAECPLKMRTVQAQTQYYLQKLVPDLLKQQCTV